MSGHATKISVHASGQIHMHRGPRDLQLFAPGIPVGNGWTHALEIRFLVGADANFPPETFVKLKKKKDKAALVDIPEESILVLNLLVGTPATGVPDQLRGPLIWESPAGDGRTAVLVGRVFPIDEVNRKQLLYIRQELNPKVSIQGVRTTDNDRPYVEILHPNWGSGGNVVFVVPMGDEGHRFEGDEPVEAQPRELQIACQSSAISLAAPDGSLVGELSIQGRPTTELLHKGTRKEIEIGKVGLSIDPTQLRYGERFESPPVRMPCSLIVCGVSPKDWQYSVDAAFDGNDFIVNVAPISGSLRNANIETSLPVLGIDEELLISAPIHRVQLRAGNQSPFCEADLVGSFLIRNFKGPRPLPT
jgi:hypothetical protein